MIMEEGQLSRAAKGLVSSGMDQDSAEALGEMKAKHPQVDKAVPLVAENTTPALAISHRQVYGAVSSFKTGSAAGLSGLRGEYLKEAR